GVSELHGIDDPLDAAVFAAVAMVVTNKQLVHKDRAEYLRLVVGEATMPGISVELEERLEPLIERFHGPAPPGVQATAFLALVVIDAFRSSLPALGSAGVGATPLCFLAVVVARIGRTEETTAGALVVVIKFHELAQAVRIVAAVGQYRAGVLGQTSDLVFE